MKYSNINELDARIEKIIRRKVTAYYTDWKNYDRPKYMKYKGSSDRQDKKLVLIVRECGTYLLKSEDIRTKESASAIYDYYHTQESADYYLIDLDRLEIKKAA